MCPIHAAHGVNDFDPFFLTTQNLFTARTPQTIWIVPEDDMCPIHAAHGVNDFDPFFLTTQNLFTARTPQTIWIVPEDDMCVRRDTLQIFSR